MGTNLVESEEESRDLGRALGRSIHDVHETKVPVERGVVMS